VGRWVGEYRAPFRDPTVFAGRGWGLELGGGESHEGEEEGVYLLGDPDRLHKLQLPEGDLEMELVVGSGSASFQFLRFSFLLYAIKGNSGMDFFL